MECVFSSLFFFCLFCTVSDHEVCFIQLVHFVNRDSLGLANDFLSLGFLPEGVDLQLVSDALKASFGDGSRQSQDFQVFYEASSRFLSSSATPLLSSLPMSL